MRKTDLLRKEEELKIELAKLEDKLLEVRIAEIPDRSMLFFDLGSGQCHGQYLGEQRIVAIVE